MKHILKLLNKLEKVITTFEFIISCSLFVVIIIVMALQILTRRIFNRPFVWAEDLIVFLFVWTTFLGAAVLYSRKSLLVVDTFINFLSKKAKRRLDIIIKLLLLFLLVYLSQLSIQFIKHQIALGNKLGGALGIPSALITLSVVIALISMCLSTIVFIGNYWFNVNNQNEVIVK